MIIQSKKVWVLGNWLEAQIEIEEGKIKAILPYDAKKRIKTMEKSESFPALSTFIHMEHMDLIQTTRKKKVCATG